MAISYQRKLGDGTIVIDNGTSYVGIGTNSPEEQLHIVGDLRTDRFILTDTGSIGRLTLDIDSNDDTVLTTGTANGARSLLFLTETSERMRITSTGNVGIGTASPGYKLEVAGQVKATSLLISDSASGLLQGHGDAYHGIMFRGTPAAALDLSITAGDQISFYEYGGDFRFYKKNNIGGGQLSEIARIHQSTSFFNSNVGIGTSSPSQKLDVNGYARATSGFVGNGGLSLFGDNSSTNRVFITTAGDVGIGTTNPSRMLHIRKDIHNGIGSVIRLENATGGGDNKVGILFTDGTYNSWIKGGRYDSETKSFLSFETTDSEAVRIDGDGNVGIGTTSPGGKLEIQTLASQGSTALILRTSDSVANATIRWQDSAGTNRAGIGSYYNIADSGALEFLNGGVTNMILRSSGNLGIGTTSPDSKLTLRDTSNVYVDIQGDGNVETGIRMRYQNNTY